MAHFGICDPWEPFKREYAKMKREAHISELEADNDKLRADCAVKDEALLAMVDMYCELANSGDCGFWEPEEVDEVIAARQALAPNPGAALLEERDRYREVVKAAEGARLFARGLRWYGFPAMMKLWDALAALNGGSE